MCVGTVRGGKTGMWNVHAEVIHYDVVLSLQSAFSPSSTWPRFGETSCSAAPPRWDKSLGTKMWHNLVSHAMQGHSLEAI